MTNDEPTYSISGLNRSIGRLFTKHTPGRGFWVRGDVQRLSVSRSGHAYFELVERDPLRREPKAVAAAMVWSDRRQQVENALGSFGLAFVDDLSVRVKVRVTFYEASGKVQLEVLDIDPAFTAGDLALAREQVRRALRAEELYDANRKLTAPLVPLRVALVTSAGSAAYHDFTHELSGSGFAFSVALFDCRVSGPGAASELTGAIRRAARDCDVLAVVRGGGARSELAAFDAEDVARAVATAPVPVWVGVGHEVDRSICDEVAHRCFKTPTATAGALVEAVRDFLNSVEVFQQRVGAAVNRRVTAAESAVDRDRRRVREAAAGALSRRSAAVERGWAVLRSAPERRLRLESTRLDGVDAQIRALDPARVLSRGFSITRRDGAVVRAAGALRAGDRLATELADGSVDSVVEATA